MLALPLALQIEEKSISTGDVYATPLLSNTVTETLVVPLADRVDKPSVILLKLKVGVVVVVVVVVVPPPPALLLVDSVKAPLPPHPATIAVIRRMAILLIMLFIFRNASSKQQGWKENDGHPR